jgi:hypothetical protein
VFHRDMASNNMTGSLSDTLGDLQQLTYLQLGNNQIEGTVPQTLGDLQQLTYLRLAGNQIDGSIPQTLGGLQLLTALHLDNNRLTGVVPSLPFKNYTSCRLQGPSRSRNHYTCPLPAVSPLACTTCAVCSPPLHTRHVAAVRYVCGGRSPAAR